MYFIDKRQLPFAIILHQPLWSNFYNSWLVSICIEPVRLKGAFKSIQQTLELNLNKNNSFLHSKITCLIQGLQRQWIVQCRLHWLMKATFFTGRVHIERLSSPFRSKRQKWICSACQTADNRGPDSTKHHDKGMGEVLGVWHQDLYTTLPLL